MSTQLVAPPVSTHGAGSRTRLLKVCGARSRADLWLLASAGVDLVGLWHGIPGGPGELGLPELADLAAAARSGGHVEPVLVTFLSDIRRLATIVRATGIRWVQLHAFQPPGVVGALRDQLCDEVTIVKVLHLRTGTCIERRFIPAYERAGTDAFILDAVSTDGRIGSTGSTLSPSAVSDVVLELKRPFMLAGGVSASMAESRADIAAHPLFLGIDVDTAARDPHGRLRFLAVSRIARGWRTGFHGPGTGHLGGD